MSKASWAGISLLVLVAACDTRWPWETDPEPAPGNDASAFDAGRDVVNEDARPADSISGGRGGSLAVAGAGGRGGDGGTGGATGGAGGRGAAGGSAGVAGTTGGRGGTGGVGGAAAGGRGGAGGQGGSGGILIITGRGGGGAGGRGGAGGILIISGTGGSASGACGTCPANSTCDARTAACTCNAGYVPDPTFAKCIRTGGSCSGTGVDEVGYCIDDSTWVWCDPRHGIVWMNCPEAIGTRCLRLNSTGPAGACGCGAIDSYNGTCGSVGGGSANEVHYFCSFYGILTVNNCVADTGRSTGFCGTFVSSFGYQTTCFCSRCVFLDYANGVCTTLTGCS